MTTKEKEKAAKKPRTTATSEKARRSAEDFQPEGAMVEHSPILDAWICKDAGSRPAAKRPKSTDEVPPFEDLLTALYYAGGWCGGDPPFFLPEDAATAWRTSERVFDDWCLDHDKMRGTVREDQEGGPGGLDPRAVALLTKSWTDYRKVYGGWRSRSSSSSSSSSSSGSASPQHHHVEPEDESVPQHGSIPNRQQRGPGTPAHKDRGPLIAVATTPALACTAMYDSDEDEEGASTWRAPTLRIGIRSKPVEGELGGVVPKRYHRGKGVGAARRRRVGLC